MKDAKLWKVFSEFIRLRDSDENGIVKCFTCNFTNTWNRFDCGHGIPRQHQSTRYDEKNNHSQCKKCNGFEEGEQYIYAKEVDKRYGEGTWEKLMRKKHQVCKRGQLEIDVMTEYYKAEVKRLKESKGIA